MFPTKILKQIKSTRITYPFNATIFLISNHCYQFDVDPFFEMYTETQTHSHLMSLFIVALFVNGNQSFKNEIDLV